VRFASLESIRESSAAALRRFPLTLLCAWTACAILDGLILFPVKHPGWTAAALCVTLGIPACLAVALWAERLGPTTSRAARILPQVLVLAAILALASVWPQWTGAVQTRRYVQLSVFVHALVAFLPFLAVREPNGFWQYNRALLERFVVTTIFSSVLLAGLQGALASLQPLFGIGVSGTTFGLLSTWVYFVFHPWFFLAGVPADLPALEERRDYPATVKVFAQFILVPLVAIYQVLLSAYLLKVVVTGKWPSGLIGWLVSTEAAAGLLAILLVHPVRERAENLWVRTFARGFYLALVPSIVMLALSIAKRVGQYGVTEDRYFVIALTVWLAGICVYFIARRDGDIRWIPVTLALLALFTFGGPWGAYGVSRASQRTRLVRLLEANGLWFGGKPGPPAHPPSRQAAYDLSSVLTYLYGTHGGASVRAVLGPLAAAGDSGLVDPEHEAGGARARRVMSRLGLAYIEPWEKPDGNRDNFNFNAYTADHGEAFPIDGLEYHQSISGTTMDFKAGSRPLALRCDNRERRLMLFDALPGHPEAYRDTLATISLAPLIESARTRASVETRPQRLELEGEGARGSIRVSYLAGSLQPQFNVYSLTGDLYFRLLRPAPDSSALSPAAAAPQPRRP